MLDQLSQLSPATLSLDMLYLDPNNPRFSESNTSRVRDENIDNESRQKQILERMEKEFAVDRLTDSIESNGYLPIDRAVVRQFKKNKYVVLEGNRRISAAKRLWDMHTEGKKQLDTKVLDSLNEIPVLIYVGSDSDAAWIFQGLRHLSGIKDWSAYNKAQLLVKQIEELDLSLSDAGRLFGISPVGAGQWVRGYYAYTQAKDHPDFQRDIDPEIFPVFQELFGRSNLALKGWLDWNENEWKFNNEENFVEFLSWFYPKNNSQGEFDPDLPGVWDNRRIPRTLDLRLVSELISDFPEEFQSFRNGTQLGVAHGRAVSKKEEASETSIDYGNQIERFSDILQRLPILQIISEEKQELILEKIKKLSKIAKDVTKLLSNG